MVNNGYIVSSNRKIRQYLTRLTLRWKIAFAMLSAFVIILPTVWMSLFYFGSLMEGLTLITDRDVRIEREASQLLVIMEDIRRTERNYRVFGSEDDRGMVETLIARADSLILALRPITYPEDSDQVNQLDSSLEMYRTTFNALVENITGNPLGNGIQETRLSKRISNFQETYRGFLWRLDMAAPAERDSIITRSTMALDMLSLDLLSRAGEGGQSEYSQSNMETARLAFIEAAERLSDAGWNMMRLHQLEIVQAQARAQRNIITVIIVTGILSIIMVLVLPEYIVRPITSLTKVLNKVGEGDFKSYARINSRDEIGDLAAGYNEMLDRMRRYDELKTQKIASQRRAFDRLLENLRVPACIVNRDMIATFYNTPFAAMFGSDIPQRPPEGGFDLRQNPTTSGFADELKRRVGESVTTFTITVPSAGNGGGVLRGRVVRNTLMQLDTVVLVGEEPAETG